MLPVGECVVGVPQEEDVPWLPAPGLCLAAGTHGMGLGGGDPSQGCLRRRVRSPAHRLGDEVREVRHTKGFGCS